MREAIGGTWLYGIVITFIVFFASFLAVSINYSKTFNVKNNIVDIISKYEGNNCNARLEIADYLKDTGYLVTGSCPEEDEEGNCLYKGYNINGNPVGSKDKAYYWISDTTVDDGTIIKKQFYRVVIFFRIDLPIVGDLFTFNIKGETESVYFPANQEDKNCTS